jgi:hypothetical protein
VSETTRSAPEEAIQAMRLAEDVLIQWTAYEKQQVTFEKQVI